MKKKTNLEFVNITRRARLRPDGRVVYVSYAHTHTHVHIVCVGMSFETITTVQYFGWHVRAVNVVHFLLHVLYVQFF